MRALSVSATPGTGYRVLVVDNEDSFTGSLVHQLRGLGADVRCVRGVGLRPDDADGAALVVLSPGPGRPEDHPANAAVLRALPAPVFGVCLGLQAIGLAYGGEVVAARSIVHGRTSAVRHRGVGAFEGLPTPLRATRYHSLALRRDTLPACLEVTAWTADGEIMGARHRELPVEGVQFHPESVRTPHGLALLGNVLRWAVGGAVARAVAG